MNGPLAKKWFGLVPLFGARHDIFIAAKTKKPFPTLQIVLVGPPPNWQGPPPCKGTEIFVGKIPREMFEWELVPIFEMCGFIYELRLMMDFSGSNRGYLFVRYSKREEASRALKELNNFEIRPGKFIGVIPSVDNRKLWISGLPKNRSADEIRDEMSKLTDGVTAVSIYYSYTDKTKYVLITCFHEF